ncbi:MAG: hypothetical protein V1721_01300 [Pseudomonadota bacterium]
MDMRHAGYILKEVVTDPGVGFSVRNVLLFAAGYNVLGLSACLAAAVATIALKTLSLTNVRALPAIILDKRLTLWIISAALLLTAAGALAKGAYLPAMAGILFAAGNIRIAESLSKKGHDARTILSLLFKRPDIYINGGTALACWMAGNAALWVFPLVVVSTAVMLRNAWLKKPECTGYPKTMIASATLISAVIAFANASVLIGISHVLGAWIVFSIERRIIRLQARG